MEEWAEVQLSDGNVVWIAEPDFTREVREDLDYVDYWWHDHPQHAECWCNLEERQP